MFHNKTKIVATVGAFTFLCCVGAATFMFHTISAQKQFYYEKVVERAVTKSHQESLAKLLETLDETRQYRETLISRVLHEEDVIDFLALIESIGQEQGVTLKTDSLTVEPVSEIFEKLIINISVGGSHTAVMQVLKLFELVPYQSSVRKVTMGRDVKNEKDMTDVWKGTFELSVTKFKKI